MNCELFNVEPTTGNVLNVYPDPSLMYYLDQLSEELSSGGPLCIMCGNEPCRLSDPSARQAGIKQWLMARVSKYAEAQFKCVERNKIYFDFLDRLCPAAGPEDRRFAVYQRFPELHGDQIEAILTAWWGIGTCRCKEAGVHVL